MGSAARLTSSASMPTFNHSELATMITTAAQYGVKVAAHASEKSSVQSLLALGVHSVEHATWDAMDNDIRDLSITNSSCSTTWVPTLAVVYAMRQSDKDARWLAVSNSFKQALAAGFDRIACGGDTGTFPHGQNALEMQLMVQLGADWRKALQWGTLGGWKCIRSMKWEGREGAERLERAESFVNGGEDARKVGDNEVPFGAIRKVGHDSDYRNCWWLTWLPQGWAADIIATDGDLKEDFAAAVAAGSIQFVMKGSRLYKVQGQEVPWM
jgi:imidazolonepropionase-like amidohydrolase